MHECAEGAAGVFQCFKRSTMTRLFFPLDPEYVKGQPQRSTLDVLLSTTYSRSQLYLSRQLAQLHPELTMPMFSGE